MFSIKTNGKIFKNIVGFNLNDSLLNGVISLTLTVTIDDNNTFELQKDVEFFEDLTLLFSGYIFAIDYDFEGTKTITCVTYTKDVIDSSHIGATQINNSNLLQILNTLSGAFGVKIQNKIIDPTKLLSLGKPIKKFGLEKGENVFDAMRRACKQYNVGIKAGASGDFEIITTPGGIAKTAIVKGVTKIISASYSETLEGRYSEYIFESQTEFKTRTKTKQQAFIVAKSIDSEVDRYRPQFSTADSELTTNELQNKADYEKNLRKASTIELVLSVSVSEPININDLISVTIKDFNLLNKFFIVAEKNYIVGAEKQLNLKLLPPELFS